MKRLIAVTLCTAFLPGCGGGSFGYVAPRTGLPDQQQATDLSACQEQAERYANDNLGGAAAYALAGVFSVPFMVRRNHEAQREEFKRCMEAKGYAVDNTKEGPAFR